MASVLGEWQNAQSFDMCTCKQCLDTTCTCEECEALLNPNTPNLLSPDQDKHFFISYQGKQASKLTLGSSHFASGLHQTAAAKLYCTHFSTTTTSALKKF